MPLVILAEWLLDPPSARLTMRQGLLWLSFPLIWIVYVLVRGAIAGLYPYPFLNPANGVYLTVAAYCGGILVVMAVTSGLTVIMGNAAGSGRRRTQVAG